VTEPTGTSQIESLLEAFSRRFGPGPAARIYRGPGRVNLIGEHTDYSAGFVLPAALQLACFVATAPNPEGRLRVFSEDLNQSREWGIEAVGSLRPAGDWGDYVAGVAGQLVRSGFDLEPANLLIRSTVPVGAGLSSSAALETSIALALLGGRPIERLELVRLCRRAENEFVGMPCGIMDQYISVFGREGAAVRIDCRSLEHEVVCLPGDLEIVAVNSMVKHELGQSAYRDRVRECKEAVEAIRQVYPKVESLRDVSPALFDETAARIPEIPRKRARHVVGENQRVARFMGAAARGDVAEMGALFVASHRSLEHDFEVSCEELDFLVEAALASPAVLGARMTGGGFGGCTVNLLRPGHGAEFARGVTEAYQRGFGITPDVILCRPSAGAGEVLP
jgi:galactokinase